VSARRGNSRLREFLEADEALCHPFVIGELACGQLVNRGEILSLLQALPQAALLDQAEALAFVETHRLMGSGLGWIDVHLLAAALLARAALWTFDRPLTRAAKRLGVLALVQ
jgi:predicted nucleic acid-binding protein